MEYQIITGSEELAEVCRQAMAHPVVMLDTEFVRIRTFHAKLGLIQLYDGETLSLIDPTTIEDMSPFVSLLKAPAVLKVLHACGEDLEVFYHEFNCVPEPMLDTQIMAAFLGYGLSTGFAALVSDIVGLELDKSESRTDWMARPLSSRQLDYAAADVFYLMPVYQHLSERLETTSWKDAAYEESQLQSQKRVVAPDVEKAYLSVKGAWQLRPRQLAVLKLIASWRLEEAMKRDLALNFVIKEAELLTIARLGLNGSKRMLAEGIHPKLVKRHGNHLCQLVRKAQALEAEHYPEPIVPVSDYPGYKQLFKTLKTQVTSVAEAHNLANEFVASRKQLNDLISWIWKHQEAECKTPDLMQGWRKPLLGETLYQMIKA
ncbi:ribonuclease D [Vibrio aerogenes]|uniref:ribonuclease D n=1 Tax=Vibrio aerogenes TaxID=92172 RepID=UPI000936537F|nr:ribonuclease D [Vibrio aerogenes]